MDPNNLLWPHGLDDLLSLSDTPPDLSFYRGNDSFYQSCDDNFKCGGIQHLEPCPEISTSEAFCASSIEPHFDQRASQPSCFGTEPADLWYRTETRTSYICLYPNCNKRFSRIYDLRRHHRGKHEGTAEFTCRYPGCRRGIRGFPRKDKRDDHERKIHGPGTF
ncbi:hypothetical protein BU26DRAFT_524849 [Trematosphaeria pertusa]|uniref:C2H2-type domain-containing protein n=1 Tax=Trematosphaeria pertusa TaxID=390896 RepID=A0A6A6HU34_9PLEO|nr:uncharacterized protein BU26DRAFT_524849 [Trematosphaeria pertusa]KAF2241685.1 hypothetical protein BU26DRAFT_524849 [Trematosphaeria pertusa]